LICRNKSWKRRYFVLEPVWPSTPSLTSTNPFFQTELLYYKSQTDKEPKGQLTLGAEGDTVTTETDVRIIITAGPKLSKIVLTCESPVVSFYQSSF